ncbi:ankyrin repeat domain-containing protein [Streptomyces sp. NPDC087300]|uniref:ankyrin repeat domain-containing protein n=1 Tax=Streptomyces sp. NPDC087300 TaxID=3365780 RepID=UPI0037FAA807
MAILDVRDPVAVAVTEAIRGGDVAALRELLAARPGLATSAIGQDGAAAGTRSLLHIATDWPGHLPHGPETIAALIAAGADPDARFVGAHAETPLHWAASNDDVPALDALVAAGADIEAGGAVIADGTPLTDACAFSQWRAARRLIEHGARTTLHEAASLGLLDRVKELVEGGDPEAGAPDRSDLTSAFWGACHGDHPATARYLLARGADRDWIGYDDKTPLDIAVEAGADEAATWLRGIGARTRAELT